MILFLHHSQDKHSINCYQLLTPDISTFIYPFSYYQVNEYGMNIHEAIKSENQIIIAQHLPHQEHYLPVYENQVPYNT